MMDIYTNNVLMECDTPGVYSLYSEYGVLAEEKSVPCLNVAIMLTDVGYYVKMNVEPTDVDFSRIRSYQIRQGDNVILEAVGLFTVLKDGNGTYRIFMNDYQVRLCAELEARQHSSQRVQDGSNSDTGVVTGEMVAGIYEKYFSMQENTSVMAERRKLRRNRMAQGGEQSIDSIMEEMDKLIGLNAVKLEVKKMIALEKNKEFLASIGMTGRPNDMLFLGNPGTGKTTVARYLTEVLYKMGKIQENKCIEINGHDLTGSFIGHSSVAVERYLKQAKGGMLFIDEAYSLLDGAESYASDAVTELLGALTKPNRDFVCVLAGYEEDMNRLMRFNAGFESRVATKLHFEDYTVEELGEIFCNLIKKYGYYIKLDALAEVLRYFATVVNMPKFSNGRFVRNLFEKMEEEHCKYFDGSDESSDIFMVSDLTDEIKQQLMVGIV